MKEYGIYQRRGTGTPYMLHIYNDLDILKRKLYDIIEVEDRSKSFYFVDNDFFNNKYKNINNCHYLQIHVRDVSDWEVYSEEQSNLQKNNILYFSDYRKNIKI